MERKNSMDNEIEVRKIFDKASSEKDAGKAKEILKQYFFELPPDNFTDYLETAKIICKEPKYKDLLNRILNLEEVKE